jgi:hypothetical protein
MSAVHFYDKLKLGKLRRTNLSCCLLFCKHYNPSLLIYRKVVDSVPIKIMEFHFSIVFLTITNTNTIILLLLLLIIIISSVFTERYCVMNSSSFSKVAVGILTNYVHTDNQCAIFISLLHFLSSTIRR